ncbi:MAG: hypothetical protein ACOX6D_02560 [Thermoguttaceae bacterium]|jgi:hypothetical protein
MPSINIKLQADTTDLDAKLSKTQKELGVHYDQYGRLINKEGQFVAGLSQARIKMGDYVDEMGRVRNANGDLMDGLDGAQQRLRMYIDEMGNVRTVSGDFVSLSRERLAALDEEGKKAAEQAVKEAESKAQLRSGDAGWTSACREEAAKRMKVIQEESQARIVAAKETQRAEQASKALGQSLASLGSTAGNIAVVAAILGQTGDGASHASRMVAGATQAVQVFTATANSIQGIQAAMAALTVATEGQTVAQTSLNLVSGNLAGIVGGALAAGATAYGFFTSKANDATDALGQQEKQVDRLTFALRQQSTMLSTVSAVQAGMMAASTSELDRLLAAYQEVQELTQKYEKAEQALLEAGAHGTGRQFDKAVEQRQKLFQDLQARKAESAEQLADLFSQDVGNDPLAELTKKADFYAQILASAALQGDELKQAEAAAANNLKKLAEETQKKQIAVAQEKGWGDLLHEREKDSLEGIDTLDEAIKKAADDLGEGSDLYKIAVANLTDRFSERAEAEKKAARETAQNALGSDFNQYAQKTLSAEEELEETIRRWRENAATAGRSEEELATAIDTLETEYRQKQRDRFMQEKGISGLLEPPAREPKEEYEDALQKLADAADQGLISAEEKDRALDAAKDRYTKALDDAAQKEEQQKNQRLAELGLAGYQEKVKSKSQKMDEAIENAKKAVAEGLIAQTEADKIIAQKRQDLYADEIRQEENRQREWQRAMAQRMPKEEQLAEDKHGGVTEIQSGSQALYKALTANNDTYQSAVRQRLDRVAGAAAETNSNLEQLNSLFSQFFESVGIV